MRESTGSADRQLRTDFVAAAQNDMIGGDFRDAYAGA